jgi:hypothetical protein
MAPAIADRRPKYVTKSCYVPMSESGQTLPMDSAPVPPDVRCCAKSDHSRRECEMTRRARNRHQFHLAAASDRLTPLKFRRSDSD